MGRRGACVVVPLLMIAGGCTDSRVAQTDLVSASPFNEGAPRPQTEIALSPAPVDVAARVDQLGRRLLAANPQANIKPVFTTIGASEPEIFHRGVTQVYITSGLVQQCTTDGQLAAVLCHELGRMVAEREALAGANANVPEREPPQDVPVGNSAGERFGSPDLTHLAELAPYDAQRRHAMRGTPLPPPDPDRLAQVYLRNAGVNPAELDQAAPLLTTAAGNTTFAKQLLPPTPSRPWTP
jgi:hypothetical protein